MIDVFEYHHRRQLLSWYLQDHASEIQAIFRVLLFFAILLPCLGVVTFAYVIVAIQVMGILGIVCVIYGCIRKACNNQMSPKSLVNVITEKSRGVSKYIRDELFEASGIVSFICVSLLYAMSIVLIDALQITPFYFMGVTLVAAVVFVCIVDNEMWVIVSICFCALVFLHFVLPVSVYVLTVVVPRIGMSIAEAFLNICTAIVYETCVLVNGVYKEILGVHNVAYTVRNSVTVPSIVSVHGARVLNAVVLVPIKYVVRIALSFVYSWYKWNEVKLLKAITLSLRYWGYSDQASDMTMFYAERIKFYNRTEYREIMLRHECDKVRIYFDYHDNYCDDIECWAKNCQGRDLSRYYADTQKAKQAKGHKWRVTGSYRTEKVQYPKPEPSDKADPGHDTEANDTEADESGAERVVRTIVLSEGFWDVNNEATALVLKK